MTRFLLFALTLFAFPVQAAIVGKTVEYRSGNTVMKSYLVYDDALKGKRPAVLVVPEWWGQNAYARKRATMLAELGYVALAVDMYGDGKNADNPKDAGALAGAVNKNLPMMRARFSAARAYLERLPQVRVGQVAALGYCFGGGIVLNMARLGEPLKGVVSYHGILASDIPLKPGDIRMPVRVFTGEADPFVPPAQVDAFRADMEGAQAEYQVISYPGVLHTFTNPEADVYAAKFNIPLKYDAFADQSSWAHTLDFLRMIFK
jgi:dienelactone hydrolase